MILFSFLWIILMFYDIASEDSLKYGHYKAIQEYKNELPVTGLIWNIPDVTRARCAGLCYLDQNCSSFFYIKTTIQCICHGFQYRLTENFPVIGRNINTGMQYYQLITGCETSGYIYESTLNICFKVYSLLMAKPDADDICKSDNGTLVVLDTEEKNSFVTSFAILHYGGMGSFWIGLTDQETEGAWQWDNGRPFTFKSWTPNQLNNWDSSFPHGDTRRSNADCVCFNIYGDWYDDNCDHLHVFICELVL